MLNLQIVAAALTCSTAVAGTAPHVDSFGVSWRQLQGTTGLTWDQVAAVCPTDGATPCSGMLGGVDVTGWVWATQDQVRKMFEDFAPEIADQDTVSGPEYVLVALGFCDGAFSPTWSFYTTTGGYLFVGGWTSTLTGDGGAIRASASAQYPVFNGVFSVAGTAATTSASAQIGVWLHDDAIAPPCPTDVNGDGIVDFADLNIVLGAFGMTGAAIPGDVNDDGVVNFEDLNAVLGVFGTSCG